MNFLGYLCVWPRRRLHLVVGQLVLLLAIVGYPGLAVAANPFQELAVAAPSLGNAQSFAVLGGSTVTNTGPTVVNGDLGVSPGDAVTGFPPGVVSGGTIHVGDAQAGDAQLDVTTAYNVLAGSPCTANLTGQDLGGKKLIPGVYCFDSSTQLTGQLTLDAQGVASSVFVFKINSTLVTATNASVIMVNGGTNCNVYWQVGSSATLGTGTGFVGSILALTSISLTTGARVSGRALARNGAVTLDTNNVSLSGCTSAAPTSTAVVVATATVVPTTPTTPTPSSGGTHPPSCNGNIRGSKTDGTGRGLGGWTIQLTQGGQVVRTTVTDSTGAFNFLGLGEGAYTVQEVQQAGWVALTAASYTVTLSSCDQNLTGFTFVNALGSSSVTTVATSGSPTPTPSPAGTAPASSSPVNTPVIPTGLPRTGDGSAFPGAIAVIVGVTLLSVGVATARARR